MEENVLSEQQMEQVEEIRAFMPEELWDKVREYNIQYGKVEEGEDLSVFDLERDYELEANKSSAAGWYKLDNVYSISIFSTIEKIDSGRLNIVISSITLIKKDDDETSMFIPEELFPYVIAKET